MPNLMLKVRIVNGLKVSDIVWMFRSRLSYVGGASTDALKNLVVNLVGRVDAG